MSEMWEILVPTVHRTKTTKEGAAKPYRTRYHRVWDKKVREISGGLTIMSPVKGQWVSPDQEIFVERMIPVRIVCTREQIEKIVDMTMIYYDQLAILAYKVSASVILKHREG